MLPVDWRPFCFGPNVLMKYGNINPAYHEQHFICHASVKLEKHRLIQLRLMIL